MLHDDDVQIGRILGRREALRLLGLAGAAAFAACAKGSTNRSAQANADTTSKTSSANGVPGCVVRPEKTEGPFFVDEKLNRSDIRSDPSDGSVKDDVPLRIDFAVSQVASGSCAALAGATVDVWHCDALGNYSDVQGAGQADQAGKKFLRGFQTTKDDGRASFVTIYPGWYQGRAVHIHFKIRSSGREFTSQLFFDESVTDIVHAQTPYSRKGKRDILNSSDGIYGQDGDQLLLKVEKDGSGYAGTFTVGLQF